MEPPSDEELTPIPPTTEGGREGARRAAGVALAGVAVVIGLAGITQIIGGDRAGRPAGETPAGQASDPSGGGAGAVPADVFARFDGTTGAFADYRGRPLVVNFWASWCPPCVAEMPDFEAVHQQFGSRVAFLGVNLTDEPAAAALVRRTGVTYDLARDPQGQLFEVMGGFSMPTTFFVSAHGRIIEQRSGQLTEGQLERLVLSSARSAPSSPPGRAARDPATSSPSGSPTPSPRCRAPSPCSWPSWPAR